MRRTPLDRYVCRRATSHLTNNTSWPSGLPYRPRSCRTSILLLLLLLLLSTCGSQEADCFVLRRNSLAGISVQNHPAATICLHDCSIASTFFTDDHPFFGLVLSDANCVSSAAVFVARGRRRRRMTPWTRILPWPAGPHS